MFKQLLPSILAIGGALLTALSPSIQKAVGSFGVAHPSVMAGVVAAFGVLYHFLPAPSAK